jgi:hypothetical protein
MRSILLCMAIVLSLSACNRSKWYPVPEQRPSFEGFPTHAARVVSMDDPDADIRFVRDIRPKTDTSWRWTGQRPAVKIMVRGLQTLKYTIDFTIPDFTLKDTGPITISFTVNDHLLDRVRYETPGYKHFEKEIPQAWVPVDTQVIVGAEVDKMWTDPGSNQSYGFILTELGLAQLGRTPAGTKQ